MLHRSTKPGSWMAVKLRSRCSMWAWRQQSLLTSPPCLFWPKQPHSGSPTALTLGELVFYSLCTNRRVAHCIEPDRLHCLPSPVFSRPVSLSGADIFKGRAHGLAGGFYRSSSRIWQRSSTSGWRPGMRSAWQCAWPAAGGWPFQSQCRRSALHTGLLSDICSALTSRAIGE